MAITKISKSELFNLDSTTEGIQLPSGTTNNTSLTAGTCNYPITATALYQFDDNVNDTCGSYNGTASNITFAAGKTSFNKAAVFNGSTSDVILPNSIDSALGNNNFSYSFWIYGPMTNTSQVFISLCQNYFIYIGYFSSEIYISLYNDTFSTSVTISANTWTHIVFLKSSSAGIEIYKNGVSSYTSTTAAAKANLGTLGNGQVNVIGRYSGTSLDFSGQMDQLRFFPSVLTSAQVTDLYNEPNVVGTTGRPSSPTQGEMRYNTDFKQVEYFNGTYWFTIDYVPEIVKTDLVLSWDTTQTTLTGSTGNLLALNGTSVTSTDNGLTKTGASYQDASGNQGWGITSATFIESNVNLNNSAFFNANNSNWTLELWVKIDTKGSSGSVFLNSWQDGGAPSSQENFIIGLYGAGGTGFHSLVRSAVTTNYIDIGPSTGPSYGNWIQVVFVADTTNVVLYVNGASVASVAAGGGLPQTYADVLTIGKRNSAGSTGGWNGIFRICRMYKAALTASDILQNYNVDKGTFGLS